MNNYKIEQKKCIICFKTRKIDLIKLSCNHEFCFKCLKKGIKLYNLNKCPLCREFIMETDLLYIKYYKKKSKRFVYNTRSKSHNKNINQIREDLRNLALQFTWINSRMWENKQNQIEYNKKIINDICNLIYKNIWYIKKDYGEKNEESDYLESIYKIINGFINVYH